MGRIALLLSVSLVFFLIFVAVYEVRDTRLARSHPRTTTVLLASALTYWVHCSYLGLALWLPTVHPPGPPDVFAKDFWHYYPVTQIAFVCVVMEYQAHSPLAPVLLALGVLAGVAGLVAQACVHEIRGGARGVVL
jgi:hypothetical protein